MAVLATGDRVLQGGLPVVDSVVHDDFTACGARFVRPLRRADRVSQLVVSRILGQRPGEIDPIAIQVDILVCDPSQPCKPVRVNRMNQQGCETRWQASGFTPCEPVDLRARPGESLDTMGSRNRDQYPLCVPRSEPSDIRAQFAALGAALGMTEGGQLTAASRDRGAKFFTRFPIGSAKTFQAAHESTHLDVWRNNTMPRSRGGSRN